MITLNQVKRVLAFGLDCRFDAFSAENQLAQSLKIYLERGEFDGSLESAIECLTLADYEIEGN